jgi:beta-glucosidase
MISLRCCSVLLGLGLLARLGAAETAAFASPQVDTRVEELLARMTLEEKVGQLNQLSAGNVTGPVVSVDNSSELIRSGMVGAILNASTAHSTNVYQKTALEGSRLHVPMLFGLDIIHGFRTLFPIPLALSASWDPELVGQTARFAAHEASRQGVRWTFSPMVDIARDPRWGRIAEGAGEDPYLGSAFARAYVHGYQGDDLADPESIVACAKHFVGYGAAEGGRDYNTTEISERTLRDIYLPPFHAAVDSGVGTLMSAFNALDGVPSTANHFTLTDILRGEWKFRGFVDSDWTAVQEIMVHGIANTGAVAARKSFLAGVDMDMQSNIFLPFLPGLVRSGQVPMARLDEAVRGILRVKFALGLFDHPYVEEKPAPRPAADPAGMDLARRAAEESFVLLENHPVKGTPLLPLARMPGRKIALIGPLADSAADMLGSWSGLAEARDATTLRTSLAERFAREKMTLDFVPGTAIAGGTDPSFDAAVTAAKQSDLVIMALGESGRSSGEASARSELGLPGHQEALLEAVVATGKPVVLVLFSGRPLAIRWAAQHVPAIVEAWFPGLQAGPALANVLFGDVAPAGRLTVSVPRSTGQIPIYYNALNTGRPRSDPIGMDGRKPDPYYVTGYLDEVSSPLYPFGYGLTYTSFEYSAPTTDVSAVSAARLNAGEATIKVSAEVRNTGAREGVETVQLYIRQRGTSVARPQHELKGFRRVRLAPGASQRVEFTLGREELAFWNLDMKHVAEPAMLYVWVAPDSAHGEPVKIEIAD